MQKFILLRGHQGSGKSTFAQEKIKAFQEQYPDAEIVHIENDLLMTDENGNYQFTVEGIEQAQRKGQTMMLNACKRAKQNPQQPNGCNGLFCILINLISPYNVSSTI